MVALACLAAVGMLFYISVQRLRTNAGRVEHTHQVLTHLDRLLSLTTDAETAQRGYVITGDRDYLAAYATAASGISEVEQELHDLMADNAVQEQRLQHLGELTTDRLTALRTVINVRQTEGLAAARELIQTGRGMRIHVQFRQLIGEIADAERLLLRERQQRVDRSTAITVTIGAGSSLLALACVAWAALVRRRDLIARKRVEGEREALKASLAAQLDDMRRLYELSSRLIEVHELPKILEEFLGATVELQHADFGTIQLYDVATASLRIVAQRGFPQTVLDYFQGVTVGDRSVSGRAMEKRARVVVEDVQQDAEYAHHRRIAAQVGYRGVQSTPIFGRDGSIKGVLSTCFRKPHCPSDRDLQMTDLYMRIAAQLIERAQDMESVRIARDEANRANQTKGRFLATASHDLRQPLQTLSLLNGTLLRLPLGADAAEALAQQEQAIVAMSGLLNALLNISKLESGAIKPQIVDFDLATLFAELRVEFSEPAARKGLRLEVAACSESAMSDRTLLGQILRNLLGNAIRYTSDGSVRLQCQRDGEQLRIDVADTGIGIPEQHLQEIFEEFYQVGIPANTAREGHGLGLSIVQRVARLLNHQLQVESKPGKGSVFSVLVPVGAKRATEQISSSSVAAPVNATRQVHVLVLDDDMAVLSATLLLLRVEGYRVTGASTLDEAVEQARVNPDIELLITDFHLKDGELGTDAIQSVREVLGRRVKAVLITGDTSSVVTRMAPDQHVQLTSKPIKANEFLGLVSALTADRVS